MFCLVDVVGAGWTVHISCGNRQKGGCALWGNVGITARSPCPETKSKIVSSSVGVKLMIVCRLHHSDCQHWLDCVVISHTDSLSPSTVSQYCHLLAHILSRVSQNQTTNKWVEPDDDDEELVNEWVGLEEAEFDPLDSPKELLACCLSIIILNKNLPLYLQTQK